MSPRRVFLLLLICLIPACNQLAYYAQVAKGQWQIVSKRKRIEHLVSDPDVSGKLKQKLQLVQKIRNFASETLDLPDNKSYRHYTDLNRSHVVWNVIATLPFDIAPKTWCFPIAGCVAYKGFFSEVDAKKLNAELLEEGYDT